MNESNNDQATNGERTLITFTLFAYNQEKYIREAVEGALAQAYSPLEIILSDDCSTDRTFEIMREMVSGYRGPHKIVLNRNKVNLGLGPHVFRVADMASGELLIAAAGDDVSFPDRTDTIVTNWQQTRCSAFTTDEEHYDEAGTYIGYFQRGMMENCTVEEFVSVKKSLGCTWGVARKVILKYTSPARDMINEDVLLGVMAMLHHGVSYIPVATVKRTIGVGISSNSRFQSRLEGKIVFLARRAALLEAVVEILRSNGGSSAALLAERDLKSVSLLLDYARKRKAFFKALAYVAINRKKSYIVDIFKITIFRWMHI